MRLAIFDFDGTISDRDSFLDFIIFCHGLPKAILGFLVHSPFLAMMALRLYPRGKTKERVLSHFYADWDEEKFHAAAQNYVQRRLPKIIRPAALEKIHWHKKEGHRVVVVSASFEHYLKIWTQDQGIDLLATQAEIIAKKFTGKLSGANCHGQEKIRRIKAAYDLKGFDYIYAYGDSRGDLPLKTVATEFHYKPFR